MMIRPIWNKKERVFSILHSRLPSERGSRGIAFEDEFVL